MSKNLTRKGFAFGAGLALVATGFAGAPAFAATSLVTVADLGAEANTLVGATNEINLRTNLSADLGVSGNDASLKYRILNPSGATLTIKAGNNGAGGTISNGDNNGSFWDTALAANIASATPSSTDFVVTPAGFAADESGAAAEDNILQIAVAATTADVSITVQAWIDSASPAANRLDAGLEDVAKEVTVNFYKASSVTWTTVLDKPASTDTSISGSVTTSPYINGNYITAPSIRFTRQGSTATIDSGAATWSNTTKSWTDSVTLDAANNWAGMPNVYQIDTIDFDGTDVTVKTQSASNVATGDVVTINAAANTADATASAATTAVDGDEFKETNATANAAAAADAGYVVVLKKILKSVEATKTVATYETESAHGLRSGDFVTIDADANGFDRSTRVSVASVPTTTTFTVALATAADAAVANAADAGLVTYDSFLKAAVGTYTAQAYWDSALRGAAAESGTIAVASDTMKVSTSASATVQGVSTVGAAGTIYAKTGVLSVPVTLTVLDDEGDAVGAGHPVNVGTVTPTGPVKVNGRGVSGETLLTDAKGQVTLTVTSSTGTAGHSVVVEATAENIATAGFTLTWADATVGLIDLATTAGQLSDNTTYNRVVAEDGNYTLSFLAADQFFTPVDSAAYRLLVSGDGTAGGVVALASGKASVKISDNDIADTWNTVVKLQKLSGTTWSTSATYTFASKNISAAAVALGADGSNAFGNAADLSDAVAEVALVEQDKRTQAAVSPAYANSLVINGQITNKTSGAALEGSLVTISGPASILFENGQVAKRGTITVLSDANGKFELSAYSTTAQTDSVITVSTLGASSTVKVTFTGIGVGEGTGLTVTAPTKVAAASTFQVAAKLADAYGNGVEATAGRVKVTYSGAGIVFGTLPDKTDKNGALSFSALLGAADKGAITVTVQYDQNGDADFVDAKDLTVTKTILVAVSAKIVKPAKGATVTVKNASGLTIKVVRGSKSTTKVATSNTQKVTLKSGTGKVNVYVNDIKVASK